MQPNKRRGSKKKKRKKERKRKKPAQRSTVRAQGVTCYHARIRKLIAGASTFSVSTPSGTSTLAITLIFYRLFLLHFSWYHNNSLGDPTFRSSEFYYPRPGRCCVHTARHGHPGDSASLVGVPARTLQSLPSAPRFSHLSALRQVELSE